MRCARQQACSLLDRVVPVLQHVPDHSRHATAPKHATQDVFGELDERVPRLLRRATLWDPRVRRRGPEFRLSRARRLMLVQHGAESETAFLPLPLVVTRVVMNRSRDLRRSTKIDLSSLH